MPMRSSSGSRVNAAARQAAAQMVGLHNISGCSTSMCRARRLISVQIHQIQDGRSRGRVRHHEIMEDIEIERLRKAICRSFNSSPHKKKYWLALLDIYLGWEKAMPAEARKPSEESPVLGSTVRSVRRANVGATRL